MHSWEIAIPDMHTEMLNNHINAPSLLKQIGFPLKLSIFQCVHPSRIVESHILATHTTPLQVDNYLITFHTTQATGFLHSCTYTETGASMIYHTLHCQIRAAK